MRLASILRPLGIVALLTATQESQGTVAYSFASSGGMYDSSGYGTQDLSVFTTFAVNRDIKITSLGCFDAGANGISGTVSISLYAYSGTLDIHNLGPALAATSITGSQGYLSSGSTRLINLADNVELSSGNYVIVAAGYCTDGSKELYSGSAGITRNSEAGALSLPSSSTVNYLTTGLEGGYREITANNAAGGTFDYSLSAVPEAPHYGVAAGGMLGLGYLGMLLHRRNRALPA